MEVTITVKFELSVFDPPPSNEVSRLKSMVKKGIQDNWSRTGSRAIAVSGGEKYDVYVKVVEGTSNYYPVSLHWDDGDNAKCARSNNIGLPLTTLAMWYNIGCAKKLFPSTWRAAADNDFMDTAGHEWGHTILQYAEDLNYSWTHKGTSTLTQEPSSAATNFTSNPNAEIDLMKYWLPNRDGEGPPSNQTIATSEDVKRTIAIAKTTFSKYCGACPTAA